MIKDQSRMIKDRPKIIKDRSKIFFFIKKKKSLKINQRSLKIDPLPGPKLPQTSIYLHPMAHVPNTQSQEFLVVESQQAGTVYRLG